MTALAWEQVRAWRVRRHGLDARSPAGEKLGQGFGAYLKPVAFRGRLCFGPGDGQRVRFTRPDVWLGHELERPEPEAALRALPPAYGVRLLPAFDQYVVAATKQAGHFLDGDFAGRVYRPQGWLSPALLVDGVMAGVWRSERKGGRIAIEVEPFGRLPKARRAEVEAEAERLAAFLGGERALVYA